MVKYIKFELFLEDLSFIFFKCINIFFLNNFYLKWYIIPFIIILK